MSHLIILLDEFRVVSQSATQKLIFFDMLKNKSNSGRIARRIMSIHVTGPTRQGGGKRPSEGGRVTMVGPPGGGGQGGDSLGSRGGGRLQKRSIFSRFFSVWV